MTISSISSVYFSLSPSLSLSRGCAFSDGGGSQTDPNAARGHGEYH